MADPALRQSGTALLIVSLDRGDTLFAREIDRLYTPGSNRKLFNAASALHHLGPDYRFRTRLMALGSTARDTLFGDLVLVGSGDPDLETAALQTLVDSVRARGVATIAGDIRADDSLFDGVEWGLGWMWDDGPYWYWPYINALSLNDNTVTVRAAPGDSVGAPVWVEMEPPTSYVELRSSATTVEPGAEGDLDIDRHWTPKANVVDVLGTLPAGADTIEALRTVEDPALYAATVFSELLSAAGVELLGAVRREPLSEDERDTGDLVAELVSDSLAVSVRNMLKESDNLTAEQLVKTIGARVSGPPGSFETGLAAERAFLATEVGLDSLSMFLADGSGVSRYNLVTARQIVSLLAAVDRREDLRAAFYDALAIGGIDGTLHDRMRGSAAEGVARAKTGSLNGVSTLSGYVPTASGEQLAFSLLMEFFVGDIDLRRAIQDSIVAELARFRR